MLFYSSSVQLHVAVDKRYALLHRTWHSGKVIIRVMLGVEATFKCVYISHVTSRLSSSEDPTVRWPLMLRNHLLLDSANSVTW